ncbi:3-methylmercaptopropionyl-CoA dehydrogenase [Paraburkholderia domus]|uniref:acyl-CoA dehydrogenase family protein n=1 Tax=Paraburkholderia domus TaxID=2793075 RepID=UPI00191307FA|nr:acyl-CoA dehydrogenase family protein [Paraburkholderia domus]MBK5089959.1 acyl-CoA dehydrogenase family protein [Burkholderia sp. R-69927]CAE6911238.1 3-methylmercaptopropionyl-CoA dehydrogenase [Paraburkholderia domus]
MTFLYRAPLRDMRFVIEEWLNADAFWRNIPDWADFDSATAMQVLEEAGRFVTERLAPLNASGDLEHCQFRDGEVTMPAGFRDSYQAYVQGGWPTLALSSEYGGQDLPQLLEVALQEMLAAANHAWLMSPGLTHGASACLQAHGSEALKRQYLPKIASGEWLTTMCLTEPQAGTDLGLLRSKALPDEKQGRDAYRISGSKIFISGGDHNLTDNIVHLVLARLPNAPAGTRGLSLFLVPTWLDDESLERVRNGVRCEGIERKMGLKASPTCTMQFDGALGWLIGEPHRGLAAMFVMMNAARLQVAMQGVGHAESAWQRAIAYATERVQMRAVAVPPDYAGDPKQAAPIALHPAVRRNLLDLRCVVEGERVIGYWIGQWLDIAARHPDETERRKADGFASLLTPVAKAFFTKNGFAGASNALQVFGGYGYIHEYGIEQTVRDSRVSMLYEGTNEIQAIDLLVRKVVADRGDKLRALIEHLRDEISEFANVGLELRRVGQELEQLCFDTGQVTTTIIEQGANDAELPYRIADDYLEMIGWLLLAYAWARTLRLVACASGDDPFYADKCVTGHYFFGYKIAEFAHCKRLVEAGCRTDLPFLNPASVHQP